MILDHARRHFQKRQGDKLWYISPSSNILKLAQFPVTVLGGSRSRQRKDFLLLLQRKVVGSEQELQYPQIRIKQWPHLPDVCVQNWNYENHNKIWLAGAYFWVMWVMFKKSTFGGPKGPLFLGPVPLKVHPLISILQVMGLCLNRIKVCSFFPFFFFFLLNSPHYHKILVWNIHKMHAG